MAPGPDRWATVERLYHEALTRPVGGRSAFLADACAGDDALRHEVESLLAHDVSADDALGRGAVAAAAGLMSDVGPSALTGRRIGAYHVLAQIGAGGMGEVYRARDTRLGRDVAIKILPREFTSHPDRLARFEREARVLASLNHPHIAAIYGVEDQSTDAGAGFSRPVHALVLELVEGDTLADRIARRKGAGLPINEALGIARQIADALDAAHEKGIVHRDLKPANIKITPEGVVKVLDFGLAKLDPHGSDDESQAPTITINGTREGLVVGTAAYMSPEQARGLTVDKRTDIWAFGCVLFEMLTGRPPFAGLTVTDTLAAIIERQPGWSALPSTLPSRVRPFLQRCLEKDPRQRLRDIGDARLELEDVMNAATTVAEDAPISRNRRKREMLAGLVAGVVATSAVGLLVMANRGRPVDAGGPTFSRIVRFTTSPAREWAPAISPDGKWVAYLSNARGPTDVWVKFVGGGDPVNLTAPSGLEVTPGTGIGGLDVSPDGTRIAVMARMRGSSSPFETWEIPAPLPGAPRKLLEGFVGARWSLDGRRITFVRAGGSAGDALWVANADGTGAREIIKLQGGTHIHWPTWSPDGAIYFIYTKTNLLNMEPSEIARIKPDGGQLERVITTSRRAIFPLPLPDGSGLIYAANPTTAELSLWFRSARGGTDRRLTSGIGEYAEPRISADGRILVCTLYDVHESLIRVGVTENFGVATPITDGTTGDLDPTLDVANDRIVFSSARDGNRHLWSARLDGSGARPLTSGASLDERPSVSPDGRQVAFVSDRSGQRALWLLSTDGGAPRKLADVPLVSSVAWTRDSREITFAAPTEDSSGLWATSVADGRTRQIQLAPAAEAVGESAPSPTADVIGYIAATTSGPTISRLALVDLSGKAVDTVLPPASSIPGGGFGNGVLSWAPDGKRLAVVSQGGDTPVIWIVEPNAAPTPYRKLIEFPGGPRIRGVTWARDGSSIIVGKHDVASSDIVMLDSVR